MLQTPNLNPIIIISMILLMPVIGIGICFIIKRPRYFESVGIMLGVLFNIPYLILFNMLTVHMGWWHYMPAENTVFQTMPVELVLGWAFFWGGLLPYAMRQYSIPVVIGVALMVDVVLMPVLTTVFTLGDHWIIGEFFLLLSCLLPALFVYKITVERNYVFVRALMQSLIWGGWVVFLIPAVVLHHEGKDIFSILQVETWKLVLFSVSMMVSMAIGYAGLWAFAKDGKGTPIPFDPPQTLVSTGIYAYVRNPLQVSTLLMFICIAVIYQSWMMLLPMLAHIIYCEGFVRWHHSVDIEERFGEDWFAYKRVVKNWVPRLAK